MYYYYIQWEPPVLSHDEKVALGKRIALEGRSVFVQQFRRSIAQAWRDRASATFISNWCPAARWIYYVLATGLILAGFFLMTIAQGKFILFMACFFGGIYALTVHRNRPAGPSYAEG